MTTWRVVEVYEIETDGDWQTFESLGEHSAEDGRVTISVRATRKA